MKAAVQNIPRRAGVVNVANATCLQVQISRKRFPSGRVVFNDLRFDVREREFVSIVAPSGCGKTTLLRMIAGLDTDFLGAIVGPAGRVTGPGLDRGIVFQESRLLPWLTVEGNVSFALPKGLGRIERARRVNELLKVVHLSDSKRLLPYQLSGGMERRVALARALANLPAVLLLDEPLSSLDLSIRRSLQDEIAAIHSRERLTTILVTHDVDEALFLSDRIIVMSGSPARVIDELRVAHPRARVRSDSAYALERQRLIDAVLIG